MNTTAASDGRLLYGWLDGPFTLESYRLRPGVSPSFFALYFSLLITFYVASGILQGYIPDGELARPMSE